MKHTPELARRPWAGLLAVGVAAGLVLSSLPRSAAAEEAPPTRPAPGATAQSTQPPVGAAPAVPGGFDGDGGNPADLLVANKVIVDPGVPLSELSPDERAIWQSQWNTVGPAFGTDVQSDDVVRAGGLATITVPLIRRATPGVLAKDVRIRLTATNGRIVRVKGAGWNCRRSGAAAVCSFSKVLGSSAGPAAVTADLRPGSHSDKVARITAVATWKEQRIVNAIGGSTGRIGTYRTAGWKPGRVSASESLDVLPELRLQAVSSDNNKGNALITVGPGSTTEDRTITMNAIAPTAAGQPVDFAWKQISGPELPLDDTRAGNTPGAHGVTAVAPGTLRKPTDVKFRVTAASGGARAIRTIGFTVVPSQRKAFPMTPGWQKDVVEAAPERGTGHAFDSSRDGFNVISSGEIVAGKPTRVRFAADWRASGIKKVSWTQTSGPPVVITKTGRTTAKVTRTAETGVATVMARATVAGRGVVERAELLQVGSGLRPAAVAGQVTATATAEKAPLCSVADIGGKSAVSFTLPGSVTLTVDKTDLGKNNSTKDITDITADNCAKWDKTLTFTEGVLSYSNNTFRTVVGEISADKLDLTKVKLKIDDLATGALKTAWAKKLGAKVDPEFTLEEGKTLQAKWDDAKSKWGALDGDMVLDSKIASLPILPLPSGWTRKPTALEFKTEEKNAKFTPSVTIAQEYDADRGGEDVDGQALFVGELSSMNVTGFKAHVANLAVLTTADGHQVSFVGDAEIKNIGAKWEGSVEASVNCPTEGCELVAGAHLKKAKLSWSKESDKSDEGSVRGVSEEEEGSHTTIAASAELDIDHFGSIAVEGSFTDSGRWDLAAKVAATEKRQIKTGVTLTKISGEVKVATPEPTKETPHPKSYLTFGIGGELQGLSIGNLTGGRLAGEFSNICSDADQEAEKCDRTNLHLQITATGKLRLGAKDVDITALGIMDLAQDDLELTGIINSAEGVGPADLKLEHFGITLTNNAKAALCTARSSKKSASPDPAAQVAAADPDPKILMVMIGADARFGDIPVQMYGQYAEGGQLCMWGAMKEPYKAGGMAVNEAYAAYSSFDATLALPGDKKIDVDKNTINVVGDFETNGSQTGSVTGLSKDRAGNPLNNHVTIALTFGKGLSSFSAKAEYVLARPWMLSGTPGNGMSVGAMNLQAQFETGKGEASIGFAVTGNYETPSANGVDASKTPLFVKLSLEGSETSVKACLSAGAQGGQPIPNAFGIADFTLSKMDVAGCLAGNPAQSSAAFNFEAQLPGSWVKDMAILNSPNVAFGFNLSITDPCLVASIGNDRTPDAPDTRKTAFDLVKGGFLTAKFMKIVIAPVGCELPLSDSKKEAIQPGFAFAFDGRLIGADVFVNVAVGLKPFFIKAAVELPALETAGFSLTGYEPGTPLKFGIDTQAGRYTIDAALELGTESTGARVRMLGDLNTQAKTLTLKGNGDIRLAAVTLAQGDVVADLGWGDDPHYKARVNGKVDIFGIVTAAVGADLVYENKQLKQFYFGVNVKANVAVAKIDGSIIVEYCLGTLNDFQAVADEYEKDPTKFTNDNYCTRAENHKRVRVWGAVDVSFLLWKTHKVAVLYNRDNDQPVFEDYNVPTDRTPPAVPTVDDMARLAGYTGLWCPPAGSSVGTLDLAKCQKTWIKPIQGIGNTPCVASEIGVGWDPKDGGNPPPDGSNYLKVSKNGKVVDLPDNSSCDIQALIGVGPRQAAKPTSVELARVGCSRYASARATVPFDACLYFAADDKNTQRVLVADDGSGGVVGSGATDQMIGGIQQLIMNFGGVKTRKDLPNFRKGTLANQQSNRCLDVPFKDATRQLQIENCNGTDAQTFEYLPDTQQLRVLGKCVYRDQGKTWFYAKVQNCDSGSQAQKWELTDQGQIVSLAGGGYNRYVLEPYGTDNDSLVYVRDNKYRTGMMWYENTTK